MRNIQSQRSFSDLEYGDPSKPNVVERYGAEERVVADRTTRGVVLVPVDTCGVGRRRRVHAVPRDLDIAGRQITSLPAVLVRGEVVALAHTALVRLAANVVLLVFSHVILAQIESTVSKTVTEHFATLPVRHLDVSLPPNF